MTRLRIFAKSIVTKITAMILILILPMNVMLIMVTKNSMDSLIRQTLYLAESTLNIYMGQLDRQMQSIDTYLYSLIDSNTFFWQLVQTKEINKRILARFNLNNEFEKQLLFNDRYAALFWYREGDGILLNLRRNQLEKKADMEAYLVQEAVQDEKSGWYIADIGGEAYLLHVVKQHDVCLGGLIRARDVTDEAEEVFEYQDKMVRLREEEPDTGEEIQDTLTVHAPTRLKNASLVLSLVISRKEVLEQLPFLQKMNYYVALLMAAVIPILLFILRNILIKPLMRITAALHKIGNGDQDYRIEEYRTSLEFSKINHAFNSMLVQIRQLKIDNYEREIEKNQLEIKNLQLQIRPHFLLNAFNLIYSLAQMKDYQRIQKMILCLTTYYRDGVRRNDDFRTVEQELVFVENYLELARMRYPDCFEVEMDVEETARELMIPTMLIQIFVENVVTHLVKVGSFLTISILVRRDKDAIQIQVCDDGEGIAPEILAQINKDCVVMKHGEEHIGIWNCRRRLRMLYGDQASLVVESQEAVGTRIRIRLPLKRS